MEKQKSCEERTDSHLESRLEDLDKLWAAYTGDEDDYVGQYRKKLRPGRCKGECT